MSEHAGDDAEIQSPEELAVHFGNAGPVAAAREWLEAIMLGRDFRRAWSLMDDNFRLCRAQAWIFNNRGHPFIAPYVHDEAAVGLAAVPSEHPLWDDFADTELDQFTSTWAHIDVERLGAGSRPRPLALDYEIVVFIFDVDEPLVLTEPTLVEGLQLVVHRTSAGWRVAAIGESLPQPGWPPTW